MKFSAVIASLLIASTKALNLVETAIAQDPEFSTLVELVTLAGLDGALAGDDILTVFAPNNAAFEALDADVVANLKLPESKDALTNILMYHVIAGNITSADLVVGPITMLNEAKAQITLPDSGAMINDAKIVTADVAASNGVIHIIDKVIFQAEEENMNTTMNSTEAPTDAPSAAFATSAVFGIASAVVAVMMM